MKLEIKIEKIVVRGERRIKITEIKGLNFEELPKKYTDSQEHVYVYNNNNCLRRAGVGNILTAGKVITQEELKDVTKACELAAAKLKKINKELNSLNRSWNGEIIYIF